MQDPTSRRVVHRQVVAAIKLRWTARRSLNVQQSATSPHRVEGEARENKSFRCGAGDCLGDRAGVSSNLAPRWKGTVLNFVAIESLKLQLSPSSPKRTVLPTLLFTIKSSSRLQI